MKDDKLNNAISELPEFEAPDVWNNIEKKIIPRQRKIIITIVLSLFIVIGVIIFINYKYFKPDNKPVVAIESVNKNVTDVLFNDMLQKDNEIFTEYSEAGDYQISLLSKKEAKEIDILNIENTVNRNIELDRKLNANKLESFSEFAESDLRLETIVTWEEKGNNLVRNPSFEQFKACPSGINGRKSRRLIPDWYVPNRGTPDYFNVCSAEDAGVPNNFAGTAKAHSGVAYAGLILRQNFTRDNKITGEKPVIYREYLQNELKEELIAGKTYKIKFWVRNSSKSRFSVDAVAACLTLEKEWVNHKEVMELIPVIENSPGNILMNQNYWVAIEGYYKAQGGEKYLTIGNFKNNFSTNYMMQDNEATFNYAYYYIDDVSVIEVVELVETYLIDFFEETPIGDENMSQNEFYDTDW